MNELSQIVTTTQMKKSRTLLASHKTAHDFFPSLHPPFSPKAKFTLISNNIVSSVFDPYINGITQYVF